MEDNKSFEEKRQYPRYNVGYKAYVYIKDEMIGTTVLDISEVGAGIMLSVAVDMGEVLQISIFCPQKKDEIKKINLSAKVVWTSPQDEKGQYRAGLEITKITADDYAILTQHIQDLSFGSSS